MLFRSEEPPASDDVAAVRFQLPQGIKLARRFHKSHTVKVIIIFICRVFLSFFFSYFVKSFFLIFSIGETKYFNTTLFSFLDFFSSCTFHFVFYMPTFCNINLLVR